MSLFSINNQSLTPLSRTQFSTEGILERQHLQVALKANVGMITSDCLVIAEEFSDWEDSRRSIDLLAIDKDANLVVIELKRDKIGAHMELQALRYAAMIANMTFDKACDVFKHFIEKNNLDIADPRAHLLNFVDLDEDSLDDFGNDVRIVLASADFGKELTTSVLWLRERDIDISCVRLTPYKYNNEVLVNAEQIIPIPEAESYQVQIREKKREQRIARDSNRDTTKFTILIDGVTTYSAFKKADLGLNVIRTLDENAMLNDEEIAFLKSERSCSFNLIKRFEDVTENEKKYSKYRVNGEAELAYQAQEFYVARNWGVSNTQKFIDVITARYPRIILQAC